VLPNGPLMARGDASSAPNPLPCKLRLHSGQSLGQNTRGGLLVLPANWIKLAGLLVAAVAGASPAAVIIEW